MTLLTSHQEKQESDEASPFKIGYLWRKSIFSFSDQGGAEESLFSGTLDTAPLVTTLFSEPQPPPPPLPPSTLFPHWEVGCREGGRGVWDGGLVGGEDEGGREEGAMVTGLLDIGLLPDLDDELRSARGLGRRGDVRAVQAGDGKEGGAEIQGVQGTSHDDDDDDDDDDVWRLSLSLPAQEKRLRTWEAFGAGEREGQIQEEKVGSEREEETQRIKEEEGTMEYISEAGAEAFDAALVRQYRAGRGAAASSVMQGSFLLQCLKLLGLGRGSGLFYWEDDNHDSSAKVPRANTKRKETKIKAKFTQTVPDVRFSGLSLEAVNDVIADLGNTGAAFVELRWFVEETYAKRSPLASRIALARCVQVALEVLERELSGSLPTAKSVLQVLGHFEVVGAVLRELRGMAEAVGNARSDGDIIKAVQGKVWEATEACSPYRDMWVDVLHRVGRPWVEEVSKRVGLSTGETSESVDPMTATAGLVSVEEAEKIQELETSLAVLKNACPDHPLLMPASWGVEQPDLNHSSLLTDAGVVLAKAQKYEADLMLAIRRYNTGARPTTTRSHDFDTTNSNQECLAWADTDDQQHYFSHIGNQFTLLPSTSTSTDPLPSNLRSLLQTVLSHPPTTTTPPHVSSPEIANLPFPSKPHSPLLPLHPYLPAQSRLLNTTLLRLLLRTNSLRHHLHLHHSFSLFGSPLFTTRLSTALFASSSSTAVRRSGAVIGGSGEPLGLRLDDRDRAWPPGGSELRLALMGILTEVYAASFPSSSSQASVAASKQGNQDLPGGLSFSIREMEDEEVEKILNAGSIYALDFLRLSYQVPEPLDLIITERSVEAYDEVFKTLLRVLRIVHVTAGMKLKLLKPLTEEKTSTTTTTTAFVNEAHHFVQALSSYIFDTGIGVPWKNFSHTLDTVESILSLEDAATVDAATDNAILAPTITLHTLRTQHEDLLLSIRTRLFLRQKQRILQETLHAIFACILSVWTAGSVARIEDLEALRSGIGVLLRLLRETTTGKGRKGGEGPGGKSEGEALEVLRVGVGGNGFYDGSE